MDTRQIEFAETVKIGTETYEAGDRKTFPKAEADQYIELGWAKCCETGETGERQPGSVRLQVNNAQQDAQ